MDLITELSKSKQNFHNDPILSQSDTGDIMSVPVLVGGGGGMVDQLVVVHRVWTGTPPVGW